MEQADVEIATCHKNSVFRRNLNAELQKFHNIDKDNVTDSLARITELQKDAIHLFIDEMHKRKANDIDIAATEHKTPHLRAYKAAHRSPALTQKTLSELAEEHVHLHTNVNNEWSRKTPPLYKSRLRLLYGGRYARARLTAAMVRELYVKKMYKLYWRGQ